MNFITRTGKSITYLRREILHKQEVEFRLVRIRDKLVHHTEQLVQTAGNIVLVQFHVADFVDSFRNFERRADLP